ncbi:putative deoxyribonuclease TATDN1 [Porphyridium purpureum]|uniref:Putative deoxyribonuclease TATDN1 n=1 Tax=Porphyridium purpureum TaxID=35688 RepID=A0A5J4ZBB6_PORPP|nr:putative deoxyribonuclease TATDN1 [Porphyridium purpureum]|eukprot:POR5954..scf295_1
MLSCAAFVAAVGIRKATTVRMSVHGSTAVRAGSGSMASQKIRAMDVALNLTDAMYKGQYNGSQKHPADMERVLRRGVSVGVDHALVLAGTLSESREALALACDESLRASSGCDLFCTAGVHPTRSKELFDVHGALQSKYLEELRGVIERGKATGRLVAVGETGLDYDRLHFCDIETQKRSFLIQIELAEEYELPMLLHNRNTAGDFVAFMRARRTRFTHGVVHSYTGSADEAAALLELGLYIGLNGCSFKTEDNLDTAKTIPLERVLVETDGPYCGVRPTHASATMIRSSWPANDKKKYEPHATVKGRVEPCHVLHVLEILAQLHDTSVEKVARITFENSQRVFGLPIQEPSSA